MTFAAIFTIYLSVMLLVTKGQSIRIETIPVSEDYVIECSWYSSMFVLHGGRSRVATRFAVINSNETYNCGYSFLAALTQGHPLVLYKHPTYTGSEDGSTEVVDGITVVRPITKIQKLDEQKAKFKAGYWDKRRNPGWEYLGSIPGCGFPHQYFDHYKQVRGVDIAHFKAVYQKTILECLAKLYIETKLYDPRLAEKLPEPSVRIEKMWESIER